MATATEREQFAALVWTMPIRSSDAIVVLTGDGLARLDPAVHLFAGHAAPRVIVSGGLVAHPYSVHADECRDKLVEAGIAPDSILCDGASQHTRDSADNVLEMCAREGWRHLLLVTSPYHAPRALLTFIGAGLDRGDLDEWRIAAVPLSWRMSWFERPVGQELTRLELLSDEYDKIGRYAGHVASYGEGISYIRRHWGPQE